MKSKIIIAIIVTLIIIVCFLVLVYNEILTNGRDKNVDNPIDSGDETSGEGERLLYNFCDDVELLGWIEKYDYKQYFTILRKGEWDYNGWSYTYNKSHDIVPDAETAYAMADILLKNVYKDHPYIKFKAGVVEYDKDREVWIIFGETVGEVSPYLDLDVGGMVVLRKSDGAVLWLS